MTVGIDDMNVAAGRRCIELQRLVDCGRHTATELAAAGFRRRSVLNVWEDPVTLAVEAAKPLIEEPESIGLLLVGTETGLDYGKPLSSYVHRALGLGANCRNAEIKHACYGQTMALHMACGWVRQGADRRALIIGTDICRNHTGRSELTGGIGAVAMTVSNRPRVLEIDCESGCAAMEVWDVARPTPTVEHGDAVLSLCAYLDALECAWEDLHTSVGITLDEFRYCLYHCPLVSLVRQAHTMLTGDERDFDERVAPSLGLNRELGNIYGGSLYASLLGLFEATDVCPGTRIGLFSYGSGACAELWTGRVGPESSRVRRHQISERLAARQCCTLEEWLAADEALQAQLVAPDLTVDLPDEIGGLVLSRIVGWHRTYYWA